MELFSVIEDAAAIVRAPKGVFKQTKVYQRGDRVFIPHSGGFLRVVIKFGDTWSTSHPDIKVLEIEGPGIDLSKAEPRFAPALKVAA